MSIEVILIVAVVVVVICVLGYGFIRSGGSITDMFDPASNFRKKAPIYAAVLGGLLLLIGLAVPSARKWLAERDAARRQAKYDTEKSERQAEQERLAAHRARMQATVEEDEAKAAAAAIEAAEAVAKAEVHHAAADDAHTRAETALERADRIRRECEDSDA